jgi:hypothetical protein
VDTLVSECSVFSIDDDARCLCYAHRPVLFTVLPFAEYVSHVRNDQPSLILTINSLIKRHRESIDQFWKSRAEAENLNRNS